MKSTSLFVNVGYLRQTPNVQSIKIVIICIMYEISLLGGVLEHRMIILSGIENNIVQFLVLWLFLMLQQGIYFS